MRLFGHADHLCDNPWEEAPPWAIELREMLSLLLQLENEMETEIMVDYTKLNADIAAQTSVLQSVVVAQQGLTAANAALTQNVADLKSALAANDPTAAQAAADAIDAAVQSNTALVAGMVPAVTANTPTPAAVASAAATAAAAPAAS